MPQQLHGADGFSPNLISNIHINGLVSGKIYMKAPGSSWENLWFPVAVEAPAGRAAPCASRYAIRGGTMASTGFSDVFRCPIYNAMIKGSWEANFRVTDDFYSMKGSV